MAAYRVGDRVRLLRSEYGTAQGPSSEHGDGAPREVPAGALCEVFSLNETLGWLTLHYDLDYSGAHEPYRVELVVEPDDVESAEPPPFQGFDGTMPDPHPDLFGSGQ
jgi:hypothetical protein